KYDFFFQAEDGIRDFHVTGVQTCALPIYSDDCIAIYGHRWSYYGDTRNITVRNSVLWADVAHPTMVGIHGDHHNNGSLIENISRSEERRVGKACKVRKRLYRWKVIKKTK